MRKVRVTQGRFTAILQVEADRGCSMQCLELPCAVSEGDTEAEALENIREAIQGYLEAFPEEGQRVNRKREVVEVTL